MNLTKAIAIARALGGSSGSGGGGSGGGVQMLQGSITFADSSLAAGDTYRAVPVVLQEDGVYPKELHCIVYREHDASVTSSDGFEAVIFSYYEKDGVASYVSYMYGYHFGMSKLYAPFIKRSANVDAYTKKKIFNTTEGLAFNPSSINMKAIAGATHKWIVIGEGVKAL